LIVVDTSALMAIVLGEPAADLCLEALEASDEVLISAGTLAEAFLVATGRQKRTKIDLLIEAIAPDVVDVTANTSQLVAEAHRRWGRGFHRASLNFGDCFAYALAAERSCPLLYVGNDFAQTDIKSALVQST
jgi:ribonuclease VapC